MRYFYVAKFPAMCALAPPHGRLSVHPEISFRVTCYGSHNCMHGFVHSNTL
uniref:Uncharacterized protein n=1 Tax=Arundo donax TaxID=35708 RepID=A0A0A9GQL1_ARUDO